MWRTKSWQYRDQDLKAAGFARLVERLQQVRPTADRWATIKMINVMRKKFLIEWRRVREDPAYEPGLWYYDEISFIKDYDQPVPGEEVSHFYVFFYLFLNSKNQWIIKVLIETSKYRVLFELIYLQ